jgi:hypothetical protein
MSAIQPEKTAVVFPPVTFGNVVFGGKSKMGNQPLTGVKGAYEQQPVVS